MAGQDLMDDRTIDAYLFVLSEASRRSLTITRTKIAKLLYFADLEAASEGEPQVTGITWKWLDHGPYNYALMHGENDLVRQQEISREPVVYPTGAKGYILHVVREGDRAPAKEAQERLIEVVEHYGHLAAVTIKDLAYQSAPMLKAQKGGERGVILDLELARPRVKLNALKAKYRKVLDSVDASPDDDDKSGLDSDEAQADLINVSESLREARGRANRALLGSNG
ncbi:hypothetical protein GCM10009616_18280 [Microlunatus lacustris]